MKILAIWLKKQVRARSDMDQEAKDVATIVSHEVGRPIVLTVNCFFGVTIFIEKYPITLDDFISKILAVVPAEDQNRVPPPPIMSLCDFSLPIGDFVTHILGRRK